MTLTRAIFGIPLPPTPTGLPQKRYAACNISSHRTHRPRGISKVKSKNTTQNVLYDCLQRDIDPNRIVTPHGTYYPRYAEEYMTWG